ncbi:hypothetical protein GCM10009609_07590 [Pseudonocardia aurantiaca]
MIRVVLADDQSVVRAGFRVILEFAGDIEVVGEATDGPTAVQLARTLRPDVVCMDVPMPGGNGLAATREIVAATTPEPAPAVLVVTTFDLDEYVFGALDAGASRSVVWAYQNGMAPQHPASNTGSGQRAAGGDEGEGGVA